MHRLVYILFLPALIGCSNMDALSNKCGSITVSESLAISELFLKSDRSAKFISLNNKNKVEYFPYSNTFFEQIIASGPRLLIGPKDQQINLMVDMASQWGTGHYYVLYVSLISHTDKKPGRYQSPTFQEFKELKEFMYVFKDFFEGDGRHHVWIVSPENGILVYDQHNIIYAYGNLGIYAEHLRTVNFEEEKFEVPCPHYHSYANDYDTLEGELFEYWPWVYFPLIKDEDGDF